MNSIFSSEIKVRPDDIDLNKHVHNTTYLDYVQAARYEQMNQHYKMPMHEFIENCDSNLNISMDVSNTLKPNRPK